MSDEEPVEREISKLPKVSGESAKVTATSEANSPLDEPDLSHSMTFAASLFAGPLPPPHLLKGYAEIDATFPSRILKMAETQAQHRRAMEDKKIGAAASQIRRGQWLAFVIVLTAIIASATIAIASPGWTGTLVGSAIGLGSLTSLVAVFIWGRRQPNEKSATRPTDPKNTDQSTPSPPAKLP